MFIKMNESEYEQTKDSSIFQSKEQNSVKELKYSLNIVNQSTELIPTQLKHSQTIRDTQLYSKTNRLSTLD